MKNFFYIALLVLISCSSKTDSNVSDNFHIPIIQPKGSEQYLQLGSDYIFNQDSLHTFELIIPEKSLAKIDNDPAAEEYVEGMLIFNKDTLSPVGIRYKGAVGAFVGCLSGKDVFNPSGEKICTKLSMKIKINWEGRKDKFYQLTKLQFHSQNIDPSQMHERLGYWFFREMGVPAPRSVHARLIINDEYSGLYALTEQIDKNFTEYNFDETNGNLYKEVWPVSHKGKPQEEKTLYASLKTNEDNNPDLKIIKEFGELIAKADSIKSREIIEKYMNINEIISYAVVDRAIRNDDGAFHWYSFTKFFVSNHNYYWYEEPNKQKLHLIPWDLDNAFDNITSENPVTYLADDWGEISNNCEPFTYGQWGLGQWSASCDKITKGWSSYKKEYTELQKKLSDSYLSQANNLIDNWSIQIKDATLEASNKYEDALSMKRWERNLEILQAQLSLMEIRLSKNH